ncbi:MAG TPA: SCO family protein [Thermoanaerobaculia bacterium]|nr:SCO family protein [Thermoanaerobaculia bacterium]
MKALTFLVLLVCALPALAQTTSEQPRLPGKVAIAQKLGAQVPMDLMFRNEQGEVVRLGQFFGKNRPVLLNFVYYECPMLCPMTLEGTVTSLTQLKFDIGRDFDVVTVSIDPRDKPQKAAELKDKYVKRYGRLNAANGWHFLTGHDGAIKALADTVGFQYAWDKRTSQFAHPSVLLVLTPDGRTSRYFYGFEYKPRDLRLGIVEASGGEIGTATDQFLLLCFHYDPAVGKYSRNALALVRAGGVTTLALLASFIVVMVRRERVPPSSVLGPRTPIAGPETRGPKDRFS